MNSEALIREYDMKDKPAVMALFRLNAPKYFSPEEEKDLDQYLDNEIEHYFVVELCDEIVGCGGINFSEDNAAAKISWDIFHPDHQGKGLGSMLLMFRIRQLKEAGHVKLISVRTSQLAYRFYARNGFKLVEVIRDHWAEGYDMYRMEYA
jgi:[ribosomal protein S18]-alanine N-acetyltransferase